MMTSVSEPKQRFKLVEPATLDLVKNISGDALLLYTYILWSERSPGATCRLHIPSIAMSIGIDESKIRKLLTTLSRNNLVKCKTEDNSLEVSLLKLDVSKSKAKSSDKKPIPYVHMPTLSGRLQLAWIELQCVVNRTTKTKADGLRAGQLLTSDLTSRTARKLCALEKLRLIKREGRIVTLLDGMVVSGQEQAAKLRATISLAYTSLDEALHSLEYLRFHDKCGFYNNGGVQPPYARRAIAILQEKKRYITDDVYASMREKSFNTMLALLPCFGASDTWCEQFEIELMSSRFERKELGDRKDRKDMSLDEILWRANKRGLETAPFGPQLIPCVHYTHHHNAVQLWKNIDQWKHSLYEQYAVAIMSKSDETYRYHKPSICVLVPNPINPKNADVADPANYMIIYHDPTTDDVVAEPLESTNCFNVNLEMCCLNRTLFAGELKLKPRQEQVLACMSETTAMTHRAVASACGLSLRMTHQVMTQLLEMGLIDHLSAGGFVKVGEAVETVAVDVEQHAVQTVSDSDMDIPFDWPPCEGAYSNPVVSKVDCLEEATASLSLFSDSAVAAKLSSRLFDESKEVLNE